MSVHLRLPQVKGRVPIGQRTSTRRAPVNRAPVNHAQAQQSRANPVKTAHGQRTPTKKRLSLRSRKPRITTSAPFSLGLLGAMSLGFLSFSLVARAAFEKDFSIRDVGCCLAASGQVNGKFAFREEVLQGLIPEPIPPVSEEPAPACKADSKKLQFLQDGCGVKRYPSVTDRDLACPNVHRPAAGYLKPNEASVVEDALTGIVPADLQVTVILVRRIDGVPHYRYLSNGTAQQVFQPWSTTKFLAAVNAASRLRDTSNYRVGLTSAVGGIPLGDLVTSMHRYDNAFGYSSNALGKYFHNIGDRNRANQLMRQRWLDRPDSETFGGNYGEAGLSLGYTFQESDNVRVRIAPGRHTGISNQLSSFTLAEVLLRLVMHREERAEQLPGLQWRDLRVLFYGAEAASARYGPWGGMSADPSIYLQAHDMDYIERRSQGQWRIFSKLGNGSRGELVNVGYGCFPVVTPWGEPIVDQGVEFVIAAHLPANGASIAARDRVLAQAYRAIVQRIVDGRL